MTETLRLLLLLTSPLLAGKPPNWETATVISQDLGGRPVGAIAAPIGTATIALPLYQRWNLVVVDVGEYRYEWREEKAPFLILNVNDYVQFYRDGNWFIVLDVKKKKHRFSLTSSTKREVAEMHVANPPSRWKSLTNSTTKVIRHDGDSLYVETIMSDSKKQAGCFNMAELRKQGDVFTGTNRESCVCQYTKSGLGGSTTETARFTLETTVEISEVTPSRIEGRSLMPPKDVRIDCEKGQYSKPPSEWRPFTWIPE